MKAFTHLSALTIAAALVPLASCSAETSKASATETKAPSGKRKSYLLSIVGYNYTDDVITYFDVNGTGGGNMSLSTPTSRGQRSTCCVKWTEGSRLPVKVKVKWTASYCRLADTDMAGHPSESTEPFLKVADVEFNGPVPAEPQNFEVHFYPDGHVETAITDTNSPARLKLPAIVVDENLNESRTGRKPEPPPPCPPGYDRPKAFDNPTLVDAATGRALP